MVADLVKFLNSKTDGLWLVKHSNSNQGKGIEMISDIKKYKHGILTTKDKWGDSQKESSTDMLMSKLEKMNVQIPDLEEKLSHANWLGGDYPSQEDKDVCYAMKMKGMVIDSMKFPHTHAWFSICSVSSAEFLDAMKLLGSGPGA